MMRAGVLATGLLLGLSAAAPSVAQNLEAQRLAPVLARLSQLEEELREMRGRLEELEFRQGRVDSRLDRLVADVDQRLAALEGRPPTPAGEVPLEGATPEPVAPERPAANAPGERALGTIPREALLGLPNPKDAQPDDASNQEAVATLAPDVLEGSPEQRYAASLEVLRQGEWASAEAAFAAFLRDNPDAPQAANAAYWLGETLYVRSEFIDAAAVFARNYRTYGPDAAKAPDNLLKLGMSLRQVGDNDRACQTFAELATRHQNLPTPISQALAREQLAAGCG